MKIQFASDLHLEFASNSEYMEQNPLKVAGEILLLAGDSGYIGDYSYNEHPFWDWASENYKQVVCCLGNHEFYKYEDVAKIQDGDEIKIRHNVSAYYNKEIAIDDVSVFVTTLWSWIPPENAAYTARYMTDFSRIMYNGAMFTPDDFNKEHTRCLAFLKKALAESKAKHKIVLSHHVPSFKMSAPEFNGSDANGAFTVELFDFIHDSDIEYWIFGHSHRNIEAVIGNTRCVCNQLGYVIRGEHKSFERGRIIEAG